jgi:antirestriction protein ArdC
MPNPPAYRESGSAAYYLPKDDLVNLPPIEMFQTSYAATKFHEYGMQPATSRG